MLVPAQESLVSGERTLQKIFRVNSFQKYSSETSEIGGHQNEPERIVRKKDSCRHDGQTSNPSTLEG